MYLLILFTFL